MRNLIFYGFVVTMNLFIMLDNVVSFNIVGVILSIYLLVCSILLCAKKKINKFNSFVFYSNSLVIYPLLLNKFRFSFSTYFILVWVFLVILYIIGNFININREALILLLTLSTLKCSLSDLYISVNNFVVESLLFIGVLNYLWFTSNSSNKIVKINQKKNKKSKEN